MGETFEKISQLAEEVDKTEDLKEATDLANRILIEMLSVQQQQLLIMANLARAEQLAVYDGVKTGSEDYSDNAKTRDLSGGLKKQRTNELKVLRQKGKRVGEGASKRWGIQ